jgi:hypothetical protein
MCDAQASLVEANHSGDRCALQLLLFEYLEAEYVAIERE